MNYNFYKFSPSKNMTVLIPDEVDRSEHANLASKIIDYGSVYAEQLGYIENAELEENKAKGLMRLQMMGGEFCGNATSCAASYLRHIEHPSVENKGQYDEVSLEVSGAKNLLTCRVEKLSDTKYKTRVSMPIPVEFLVEEFNYKGSEVEVNTVVFDGITHFIVDQTKVSDITDFYVFLKDAIADRHYDAFGIMFFDYETEFMTPVVYVASTNTTFWEMSCASGTTALVANMSYRAEKEISKTVKQPGGALTITTFIKDGLFEEIHMEGVVDLVAKGIVFVE
ncbi:MAG: diaminopimelate epimerase [Tissierellia bacterium]|nr:diaminopimelate epimerase [Tissierellia bacterium]